MLLDNDEEVSFRRVPGLYRRWEIGELLETGRDYRLEDAGATIDGTPLIAVYATWNTEKTE